MAVPKKTAAPAMKTAGLDNTLVNQILAKSMSRVRQDVASWNTALTMARKAEKPKRHLLYNLYEEISIDGLLASQLGNRMLKSLATSFTISDKSGKVNEEATALLQDKIFVNEINKAILGSITHGHSVVELSWTGMGETQELNCDLLDRQNIEPRDGLFYPDYNGDKATPYRTMAEYGTWILEFGNPKNLGLLNNAVPHVLFKRFAQSCWSELCEIAGIPPRVMKTDTQNIPMLRRAERMMKDMGAAAWFIIDESEKFEWAQASNANGDVYQKLMTFCNNEISMLISGAVMGQDTVNGSNSKEKTMQDTLQTLVDSDLSLIEQYWNSKVIPALINIGVLSGDCVFSYPETEDIAQLWTMTKDTFQYFEVDTEWIKNTFGVQVTGPKIQPVATPPAKLSFDGGFFD
jgi:phage gp29-like protein